MPKFLFRIFVLCYCISPLVAKGLTAGFTVDHSSGCVPLIVNFTNTSTGATSYSWDFGNTFTSGATSPITSYITAGTYTVTLTAYNGPSSVTYSTVITVYPLPTVNFAADDTTLCFGTPATFTSTSTAGVPGPLTYTWNFGDGFTSTASSPSHTYTSAGYYNITLYATNSVGCVSSTTKNSYIQVYPQTTVNFSSSTAIVCKPPASVLFNNTTSGPGPLSYAWSFGDGGSSTLTSPTRTYTAGGTYDVKLKVTDGNGCKDSLTRIGYITVGGLTSAFSLPTVGCIGVPDTFLNTSSAHISSQWNFGDGGTSSDDNGVHTYTTAGTYNVRLIVYSGVCYDTVFHSIAIHSNPSGSFIISPSRPCPAPTTLTLNATTAATNTIKWLFGDDSVGTGNPATHLYAASMIHNVTMIITDTNGCQSQVVKTDTINSLVLSLSADVSEGCVPLAVSFSSMNFSVVLDNTVAPPSYYVYPYPYPLASYSWNFGDGSPLSSSAAPIHTFTTTGVFSVACTMTTSNGCSTTANYIIKVGTHPTATFTVDTNRICSGKTIYFTSISSATPTSWKWRYGDGAIDSGTIYANPNHKYFQPGLDSVVLTVYQYGCSSVPFSMPIYIDSPRGVPTLNYLCAPTNGISFFSNSVGATSLLWMFGDGDTSSVFNPTHYYATFADFNVKLATYNSASGCHDTSTALVKLTPIVSSFRAVDTTMCVGILDTFTAQSSAPVQQYRWYVNWALKDTVRDSFFYAFPTSGLYTISLVLKNFRGCYDTITKTNYIRVASPTAHFTSTPLSGCGPLTVNFTDASTFSGGIYIKKHYWSFGDGTYDSTGVLPMSHIYSSAGTYRVSETIVDSFGCVSADSLPPPITVYRPSSSFAASSTNICLGASIHFSNASTGITSSLWLFGDGSTSTTFSPDHVYTASGVYTVKLVVYESHGCTDTLAGAINVAPKPLASFSMSDSFAVCPPLNIAFTNTSTGALSYYWMFGTGASSIATSPSNPYTVPGYYTIKLVATNALGCTDTATHHASLFGYSGAFSYAPLSGCAPLNVHFSVSLGAVSNIFWDFSDGFSVSTTSDTLSHFYVAPGMYVPKLILTDTSGCSSFSYGVDTIKVNSVIPNFRITPNPVCINNSITFTDSSYSYFTALNSWTWSFGGGATSTLTNPTYTYTVAGTQTVSLSATNTAGCSGTITKTVTVNPAPAISGSLSVCQSLTSTLTGLPAGGTWSGGTAGIATISSGGIVTGVGPGTASVTYTLATGCKTTAMVTVYALPSAISGASSLCEGAIVTLSNTTTGGTWSSGAAGTATVTATTGIVTGISAGTVTITYMLGTGCFATKLLTVNPQPGIIAGGLTVCVASTTSLSNSVTGGTWSSSNLPVATINSSGVVTGVAAGTSKITYTLPAGCFSVSIVTVVPLPGTITGSASVCEGAAITLSNTTTGGTWSSSAIGVATIAPTTGIVTGISAGTVTITYMLGTGCIATKLLTVNPQPATIAGGLAVCVAATTSLTNSVAGGTWSSSNLTVATINSSGIVTGVTTGTSKITYSLPAGCFSVSVVTVVPLPGSITGPASVCEGGTITLSNTTSGGSWGSSSTGIATITATTGIVTGILAGTTTISYMLGTGCLVTRIITVNPQPSAISGAFSVCQSSTVTLSNAVTGGTWSSGSISIATINASGIVTGVSGGTSVISYILPAGCFATAIMTVMLLPAAITGPSNVCAGSVTTYSSATSGGTWSSSAPSVAFIDAVTGVITTGPAGSVTVTYTLPTGCSVTKGLTIDPLPANITGVTAICTGFTTTAGNTTSGGSWISGNTAVATIDAAGVITGIAAGTAGIIYVLPTGCMATTTVTVLPIPGPITGTLNVCEGQTTTLTGTPAGGTWSSSVFWVASISSTGIVTGIISGVTTITYTSGNGCYVTENVVVNPLPAPITGIADLCIGSVITVSDATAGGAWSSSNPAIASIDPASGQVTGISGGTIDITYTMPTGCFVTDILLVNAAPPPIGGSLSVCAGFASNLTNSMPGGTWSSSGPATVGFIHPLTGVVTGVTPGTITVTYTVLTGCSITAVVTINPLPPPIAGTPQVCVTSITSLTDPAAGGTWASSNGAVASIGIVSGIVTGVSGGTAVITYTIPTGCFNILPITVNPLPAPITGVDTVCSNSITAFADAIPGGTWSSSNISIATVGIGSGIVTGVSGGVATISYTLPTGCYVTRDVTVFPTPAITGSPGVCLGFTTTLSTTLTGGLWVSSNATIATIGSSSGIVTGLVLGTFNVTYSMAAGGCKVIKPMTVNPLPPIHAVTGGGSYCAGGSGAHISLNGSDIGISYLLYLGSTVTGYITGTGSPLDFGLLTAAGTYTALATNATTGCKSNMTGSAIVAITPHPVPAVSISTSAGDTVCPGSSMLFTPVPVNGGTPTYIWRVNGVMVSAGSTYSFIPADGDIVTVKMTSNLACVLPDTAVGSKIITVLPTGMPSVGITVDPSDTVCEFTLTNFTANPVFGGGAPTYQWILNGFPAGTGPVFSHVPDNGDVLSCRMISNYQCRLSDTVMSGTINMVVDPMIVPHIQVIPHPGFTVSAGITDSLSTIVTNAGPNPTYQWYINGVPVVGATTASFVSVFHHYDSVACVVTSSGVCKDISTFDWVFITVTPATVHTTLQGAENVMLIPNPNDGNFTIKGFLSSNADEQVSIEITNMLGQVVYKNTIVANKGKINERIVMENSIANGMYMLNLSTANEHKVFHVVIGK